MPYDTSFLGIFGGILFANIGGGVVEVVFS